MNTPQLNHLYKVTLSDSYFKANDFEKLYRMVGENWQWDYDPNRMPDVRAWKTRRGLWPKRFRSWMHKEYGVEVSDEFISKIGGMAGKMIMDNTFFVDFVDHSNWIPGSFGEEPSSCWFSTYYGSTRLGLFEHGGLAMRFFSSAQQRSRNKGTRGIGRAWILPNHYWAVFNPYGYELPTVARVLGHILEEEPKTIDFELSGGFINGDKAAVFGYDKSILCLSSINSQYVAYCSHCHEGVYGHDAYQWKKNRDEDNPPFIYHPNCVSQIMTRCDRCKNYDPTKEFTTLNGKTYCKSCLRSRRKCRLCYNLHFLEHVTRLGDGYPDNPKYICEDCFSQTFPCRYCNRTFLTKPELTSHRLGRRH